VKDGTEILSQVIFSQEDIHAHYGGVFPEMAARRHVDVIHKTIELAFTKARLTPKDIDGIAVAYTPGLMGSLLIGVNTAKSLCLAWDKPLIGVNHVEAHLYAAMMQTDLSKIAFPSLGLVISGGHTLLFEISSFTNYSVIASTQDDAIGEAFDKVAILLGYSYPGGAKIEKIAEKGNPLAYPFKPARVKKSLLDFSYSGLKTAVLYAVQNKILTDQEKADIAASFQRAAFKTILQKLALLCSKKTYPYLFVGGGVAANQYFRKELSLLFKENFYFPSLELCQDNAAMIAGFGFQKLKKNRKGDPLDLEPMPRAPFATCENFNFSV